MAFSTCAKVSQTIPIIGFCLDLKHFTIWDLLFQDWLVTTMYEIHDADIQIYIRLI